MIQTNTKVLIIGSGPAGYTAAIYAARAAMSPILYEGEQPGGQLTQTTEIENFPGFPEGIDGPAMMEEFKKQAIRFGTDIRSRLITKVDFSSYPFICTDDRGDIVAAESVIIATGAKARYLGLPEDSKYMGLGLSACATCDGFFYRKKKVAVVGGGDTACEEALYLSKLAEKVYMIVRKPYLRASDVMKRRVNEADNIEILFECNVKSIHGEDGVEYLTVTRGKDTDSPEDFKLELAGLFMAIGHDPRTELFRGQIDLDEQGYIKVKSPSTETSVPGVFAAGDVADPTYQQAVSAAGTGCRAALDAEKFLIDHNA